MGRIWRSDEVLTRKAAETSPACWRVQAGEYKESVFHSGRRIPQLAGGFFNLLNLHGFLNLF